MHDLTDLIKTKTTLAGGDTLTGYDYPQAGDVTRPARLMVQDLMPQGESASNGISYAQLTSMPVAPPNVAEGNLKTDAAFVGSNKNAKMRKAAFWQKIGWEFYNDTEVLTGFVKNFMALSLARAIEKIIVAEFSGSGATAIASATTAAAMLAAIVNAKRLIHTDGFEPDGVVISPANFETIRNSTGTPFSIGERGELGKVYFDCLYNMPVVESPAVGDAQMIVGAFGGGSQLFRHSGGPIVTVTDSDQDDFVKNLVTARIEARNAVAIYALPAFRLINIA